MSDEKKILQLPLDEADSAFVDCSIALAVAALQQNTEAMKIAVDAIFDNFMLSGADKLNQLILRLSLLEDAAWPDREVTSMNTEYKPEKLELL